MLILHLQQINMEFAVKHYTRHFLLTLIFASTFAHADEADKDLGCKVLLCLANPQGPKAASACVPPINRLFWHLAKGHSFPMCDFGGGSTQGTASRHDFASPNFCPEQYIRYREHDRGPVPYCLYKGAVTVTMNGQPYTRVWWTSQDTVTENFAAARATPGASQQFEDDYKIWKADQQRIEDERLRREQYYSSN